MGAGPMWPPRLTMAAPACTTPRRQSYGSILCQHADTGNWRMLTILCMVGDCRSSSRITPPASHSVATAIRTLGISRHRVVYLQLPVSSLQYALLRCGQALSLQL